MTINDYNMAININPDYAPAFYNRGFVFLSMGMNDSAFSDFQIACMMGNALGCRFLQILKRNN